MFFTREDILNIQHGLSKYAVKDSQFPVAKLPINNNDIITMVQDGKNVKIRIIDFLEQLHLISQDDFLNVSVKFDETALSITQAARLVPVRSRKIGLVITFENQEGKWEIWQYNSHNLTQWNNSEAWENVKVPINSIAVPDEEDLTLVEKNERSIVKFKDKEYSPIDYSGLGRKYLRKNVVSVKDPITEQIVTKNLLSQRMLNKENTIYIIQYDYDLNGETVTVPTGCTLDFQGGSIKNGELIMQKTQLQGYEMFGTSLNTKGTVKADSIKSIWWKRNNDDFYPQFKQIVNLSNSSSLPINIYKDNYNFLFDGDTVTIQQSIDFNNSTIIWNTNGYEHAQIIVSNSLTFPIQEGFLTQIGNALNSFNRRAEVYKNFKDKMIIVKSNEVEFFREHPLVSSPIYKSEFMYVDANGESDCDFYNGNIDVTSGVALDCNKSSYFKNLILEIQDTFTGNQKGGYRNIGVQFLNNANLIIENIRIPDPDIQDYRLQIITFSTGYNIQLKGCCFTNTREDKSIAINNDYSAYSITGNTVINLTFDDVRVGNLTGNAWGCTGTNYITNWVIRNSSLNRIDAHHRLHNLLVEDTNIGNSGITYSGTGTITVNRCHFYTTVKQIMQPRTDYGSYFDGDIELNDCTIHNTNTASGTFFLIYTSLSNFDFKPGTDRVKQYLKHPIAKTVIVNNIKFINSENEVCVYRIRYAYGDTKSTKIFMPNVKVSNIDCTQFNARTFFVDYNFAGNKLYDNSKSTNIEYHNCSFYTPMGYAVLGYYDNSGITPFSEYESQDIDTLVPINISMYNCIDVPVVCSARNVNINIYNSRIYRVFETYSDRRSYGNFNIYNSQYIIGSKNVHSIVSPIAQISYHNCEFDVTEELAASNPEQAKSYLRLNTRLYPHFVGLPRLMFFNSYFGKNICGIIGWNIRYLINNSNPPIIKKTPAYIGDSISEYKIDTALLAGNHQVRVNPGTTDLVILLPKTPPEYNSAVMELLLEEYSNVEIKFEEEDTPYVAFGNIGRGTSLTIPKGHRGEIVSLAISSNGVSVMMSGVQESIKPTNPEIGFMYFDRTSNKPTWWTGTKWVDSTGADV